MFLDAERGEELSYGLFNYAPLGHYDKQIQEIEEQLQDLDGNDLVPDGGRPRKTFWAWITEEGNLLYETDLNGEEADVFYDSVNAAEQALERHVDRHPEREDRYKNANLFKVKKQGKELEGVEVLTEQSGLADFAPDGGYEDEDLIPDGGYLDDSTLFFFYNPTTNAVIQEEGMPYTWQGLHHSQEEAEEWLEEYQERHNLDDVSHFELYEAEVEKIADGLEQTSGEEVI